MQVLSVLRCAYFMFPDSDILSTEINTKRKARATLLHGAMNVSKRKPYTTNSFSWFNKLCLMLYYNHNTTELVVVL